GRFHFRTKSNIDVFQLAETEHRSFDMIAFPERCKPGLESGFFEFHTENGFHCKVCHRYFSDLAHEGYRTARSRVDFQHIDFAIGKYELYIDQPNRIQAERQPLCILPERIDFTVGERDRRIDSDGVAGVDPRPFDMLHDARNDHFLTVTDGIHLDLLARQIAVDQHWMFRRSLDGIPHVVFQFRFVIDDFHCTSAQHIAWTHQYRIADVFCIPERLFFIGRCLSERLWDIYVMQQ